MSSDQRAAPDRAAVARFRKLFFERLLEDCYDHQSGVGTGWDPVSLEWSNPWKARLKDLLLAAARRAGFGKRRFDVDHAAGALATIENAVDGLARTYDRLGDDYSKDLLLTVLALRVLGERHVRSPVSVRWFWRESARIDRKLRIETDAVRSPWDLPLHAYRVEARNGPVSIIGHPIMIIDFFVLEQYAYRRGATVVEVERSDVVIDGGGGWGETALYFADAVEPEGSVFCCEFVPQNLEILNKTLELNPTLKDRIQVFSRPLWDHAGETIRYSELGFSSSVMGKGDGVPAGRSGAEGAAFASAETSSVDEMCRMHGLERVDFIKLDVEGAELKALRGGEETLRRYRPKIAVSVYHRLEDLAEIPAYLDELELGYEFFLDHFSPAVEETVLFCKPELSA